MLVIFNQNPSRIPAMILTAKTLYAVIFNLYIYYVFFIFVCKFNGH